MKKGIYNLPNSSKEQFKKKSQLWSVRRVGCEITV